MQKSMLFMHCHVESDQKDGSRVCLEKSKVTYQFVIRCFFKINVELKVTANFYFYKQISKDLRLTKNLSHVLHILWRTDPMSFKYHRLGNLCAVGTPVLQSIFKTWVPFSSAFGKCCRHVSHQDSQCSPIKWRLWDIPPHQVSHLTLHPTQVNYYPTQYFWKQGS